MALMRGIAVTALMLVIAILMFPVTVAGMIGRALAGLADTALDGALLVQERFLGIRRGESNNDE